MTSIVSTFFPSGRVFQIENSAKAVENSETVIGIKCKDEIVTGVEMLVASKSSYRRIHSVHRLFGIMISRHWVTLYFVLSCLVKGLNASAGDANPLYRACVEQCEKTGCVGERCFPHCKFSSDGISIDGPWYMQEPLYLRWKLWDCLSDCRYNCMGDREKERCSW